MRTDILERKEDILQWIEENQSKAFMAKELHCKQETLNNYLKKMGIEYSGNQSGKGFTKVKKRWSLEEYLQNSSDIQTFKVKTRILEEGIKKMKNTNKLEILKNRLATIENKGKSTGGVQRKLQRQIRNLEK